MPDTRALHVSPDLDLPVDAVTQTFAVVGVRRSGKSNAGAVMAEEFNDAGLPWVAIDPKGDWWGLRSSADGTGPGLPVPIFGGLHGDLPLAPESGRLMAELIVEHNLTCILDVSRFSKAARIRFLVPFAGRLYDLHQEHPQPRHVFLEEASRLLPQSPRQDMAECVGAFVDLIRLGGAFGLGVTLLDQRCATLNKDGLTQVETFIGLRLTSPQDRKAVRDWMEHHAIAPEIVESLPSLKSGEGWVSSSHFLAEHGHQPIQRIRFRRRRTFDSGATPKVGEPRPVATLADIDLGALEVRMADVVEKAAQDDPRALRKQIAGLQRQLAATGHNAKYVADLVATNEQLNADLAAALARPPERVEVDVLPVERVDALRRFISDLRTISSDLSDALANTKVPVTVATTPAPAPPLNLGPSRRPVRPAAGSPTLAGALAESLRKPRPPVADAPQLKAGARNMVAVLARSHPVRLSRAQLATLAKLRVTGGTFSTYFSALKRAGLITEDGGFVDLTDAGFELAGASRDLPITPDELRETWRSALKAGARNMLDVLLELHPAPMTRAELAAAVGLEQTGGTFSTYLSTLRRNGLIDETSDGIRAADVFFLGAAT